LQCRLELSAGGAIVHAGDDGESGKLRQARYFDF
jgi:hypothetical protein